MPKTVLIIGAGASTEFGRPGEMPIGQGLAQRIRQTLTSDIENVRNGGDTPIADMFRRWQGFGPEHYSAMHRIRDGIVAQDSIDDLVNEWSEMPLLTDVAKACIAYEIASAERSTVLGQIAIENANPAEGLNSLRDCWLGYYLRYHNSQYRRREIDEILSDTAIITFNYDRCIEYYIYRYATTAQNLTRDKATAMVSNLPIVHVFGSIGVLPELRGNSPFGGGEDPLRLRISWSDLQTYSEIIENKRQQRIADLVAGAEHIIFLGFAFHRQNLDVLFPLGPSSISAKVWATTLGMRPRKIDEMTTRLNSLGATNIVHAQSEAGPFMYAQHDDLF